jgi:hypothetical protein
MAERRPPVEHALVRATSPFLATPGPDGAWQPVCRDESRHGTQDCVLHGRRRFSERGQSTIEFAISWSAVLVPMVFAIIYTAQLLWIWHSVNDYTRRGASYASTHCWMSSGSNVLEYMRNNVPAMVNQDAFQSGPVEIAVSYFGKDPDTGQLTAFSCDSDCSASCIPDTVSVSVTGFEYRTFVSSLGLPPITMPNFKTSLPMESAGCDPDTAECLP